jgi:hypothetical protein
MGKSNLREFQQNLWESWRRQDLSYLSGEREGDVWEFADDHYYPLYGLGSADADLMVIGAGPAWNVGEGANFPKYREKSWEQDDDLWTPDVDQSSFKQQEKIWRLNRIKERNTLVKTLTKLVDFSNILELGETNSLEDPFEPLYYTNFQKDGEFDETNLDEMSQRFWRDYLVREIELQSPSVILPMGTLATEAILDIYDHEPQTDPLTVTDDKTPAVVHSYHWSNLGQNLRHVDESVLPDEVAEETSPIDGTDDYWKAAAMQIDRFL